MENKISKLKNAISSIAMSDDITEIKKAINVIDSFNEISYEKINDLVEAERNIVKYTAMTITEAIPVRKNLWIRNCRDNQKIKDDILEQLNLD